LNAIHAGAAFADTWSTQRYFEAGRERGRRVFELNPLARPFQEHGQARAYAATAAGVFGAATLGKVMRESRHRWVRRLWWVPQAALTGAHAWGIQRNLEAHRRLTEGRR
jgi:hypothetical protein